jgi:transcriptional regulator with XRE-family HTH domain
MLLIQIGHELRRLRKNASLTQSELAQLAGVARETLCRIENGTYNDIGVKKLHTLLNLVGGELVVQPRPKVSHPDFVQRAVSTANTSLKRRLHADELVQALITGDFPPGKVGHVMAAFDDLSSDNLVGLIAQIGDLVGDVGRVERSMARLKAGGNLEK